MMFPMTLDRLHRFTTLCVLVAVGVMSAVALGLVLRPDPRLPAMVLLLASVTGWVSLGIAWAMSPTALRLRGDELQVVRRAWRPLAIKLADVVEAGPGPTFQGIGVRVAGTGGFFGSYGLFWARPLKLFRLYATRRGDSVVVFRRGGALPLVATPDAPTRFLEALRSWKQAAAELG